MLFEGDHHHIGSQAQHQSRPLGIEVDDDVGGGLFSHISPVLAVPATAP